MSSIFKAISFIIGHSFQLYLLKMTVFKTLRQLIINGKLFSVCKNQQDFLRNEYTHAGTATFLLTVPKNTPNCDLNAEVCAEPWLLWNVPPRVRTVSAICNKRQNGSLRVYFCQDKADSASTFTKVNTRMLMKSSYLFFYGF